MNTLFQKGKAVVSKVKPYATDEDINILLLGETGVGKSTFINSFANYLLNPNFDSAKFANFTYLIPAKFMVTKEDGTEEAIHVGEDRNEDRNMGNSSTQAAKAYTFCMQDGKLVRIIDTPGIGDARGTMQDRENFENILDFIGKFKHLHGICFLLKPNVTVINTFFKFCLLELMTRLDKSASNNIIYVFTNTRGNNYQAPDTIALIRRVIQDVEKQQKVKIPLNGDNTFCFDNEGFKHLVASQHGIKFGNPETMRESWKVSCAASWSLLHYIMGDNKNKRALPPHCVQNTVSINEARRLIVQLSKPLADITDLIDDNLHALQQHEQLLNRENLSKEELEQNLYVPVVKIRQKELSQPATVCSASKCIETYTVLGNTKPHYKQRCHDPCYLRNVPKDIIGSPELLHCYAMGNGGVCNECGCSYTVHLHIYYESETYDDRIEDDSIKNQLQTKAQILAKQQEIITKLKQEKSVYEHEHKIISHSMAKFAYFFKTHSLCPVNDAYDEYLDILIKRENTPMGNKVLLERYRALQKEHKELQKVMAQSTNSSGVVSINPNEIFKAIDELYGLKFSGPIIKKMQEGMSKAMKNEHHSNLEEQVFNVPKHQNFSQPSYSATVNSQHVRSSNVYGQQGQGPSSSYQNTSNFEQGVNENQTGTSNYQQQQQPPQPATDSKTQVITQILSALDEETLLKFLQMTLQQKSNEQVKPESQTPGRSQYYEATRSNEQRYRDRFEPVYERRSEYSPERRRGRQQYDNFDPDYDRYERRDGRYRDGGYRGRSMEDFDDEQSQRSFRSSYSRNDDYYRDQRPRRRDQRSDSKFERGSRYNDEYNSDSDQRSRMSRSSSNDHIGRKKYNQKQISDESMSEDSDHTARFEEYNSKKSKGTSSRKSADRNSFRDNKTKNQKSGKQGSGKKQQAPKVEEENDFSDPTEEFIDDGEVLIEYFDSSEEQGKGKSGRKSGGKKGKK